MEIRLFILHKFSLPCGIKTRKDLTYIPKLSKNLLVTPRYNLMPRLILTIRATDETLVEAFNKHYLQAVIYSELGEQGNSDYHEGNRFRFFSFSDFFPSGNMKKGETKKVIISSPDSKLIGSLSKGFSESSELYLGSNKFIVSTVKTLRLNFSSRAYISGSPVVLYTDNQKNRFFSLRDGDEISFFMERIKENAIKKYKQFTGKTPRFTDGPMFDSIRLKKEVSVKVVHRGGDFYIIGTLWEKLGLFEGRKIDYDFYRFIAECGIGEKNSLGFGFLNPLSEDKENAAS